MKNNTIISIQKAVQVWIAFCFLKESVLMMTEPKYDELEENNPHLDKDKPYPLSGLLVVDFTHVLSGMSL